MPAAFDQAYRNSQKIFLEADVDKLQDPAYQPVLYRAMVYNDGRTLKQVLDTPTYARLTEYLARQNVPIESLARLRPGWLSVTLATIELQKLGMMGIGVDQFYNQQAVQDNKTIGFLESVEEQIEFISNMGKGQESALINHTLDEVKTLPDFMHQTKQAWRKGDNDKMHELFNKPMIEKFPGVYQQINVDRNRNWQAQIEAMLKSPEIEMVLVGTLHLVGPDGLVAYFKRQQYQVKMLD